MQKPFSHIFEQQIWRIMPDTSADGKRWAIELRNAADKAVSFAVINAEAQEIMWEKALEGTDWWSTLTAFSDRNIYIHNFRYPDIPEPTDLLAFSATDGSMKWILPNYLLVEQLEGGLLKVATKQGEQISYRKCNAETGTLSIWEESDEASPPEVILKEPLRYNNQNAYFDKLAAFIQNVTGHVAKSIDYMEKRPFMIFSYYIYEQDKAMQYLLIVTDRREVVLHDKLSESKGMGRSTMILKASMLVYLKNNNEFSSLTLS